GALLGLGMLAQRSELVVMQASGFTRMQVALSVMKTAIPLVLFPDDDERPGSAPPAVPPARHNAGCGVAMPQVTTERPDKSRFPA
ncbi:hypothetical protein ONQ62_28260, partial [Salmonella enterica subsp. enterica serovar Virginia]|nr:hypothetical protein [Salmonella enterica subsp. enterica serovar Virginia]